MNPLGQLFTGAMSAAGAGLRGVGGVHRDQATTSIFRFVRQVRDELPPRRVMDRLREAVVMDHGVNREFFDSDHVIGVDRLATLLMGKIGAPVGDTLMDARHDLAPFPPVRRRTLAPRGLGLFAQPPLGTGEVTLVAPEETRIHAVLYHAKSVRGQLMRSAGARYGRHSSPWLKPGAFWQRR